MFEYLEDLYKKGLNIEVTILHQKNEIKERPKEFAIPTILTPNKSIMTKIIEKNMEKPMPPPELPLSVARGIDKVQCMECGKDYKSLGGHLKATHGISVEEYKKNWGKDIPIMTDSIRKQNALNGQKNGKRSKK